MVDPPDLSLAYPGPGHPFVAVHGKPDAVPGPLRQPAPTAQSGSPVVDGGDPHGSGPGRVGGGEVTVQSLRCIAFNGRLLAVGFASGIEAEDESTLTVRPILFGNCSIVGVCHAYVADPLTFKKATGFNFPSHASGVELHERVLGLVRAGKVRPVVGRTLPFERLPEGLVAMERRETVGRTVVLVE